MQIVVSHFGHVKTLGSEICASMTLLSDIHKLIVCDQILDISRSETSLSDYYTLMIFSAGGSLPASPDSIPNRWIILQEPDMGAGNQGNACHNS